MPIISAIHKTIYTHIDTYKSGEKTNDYLVLKLVVISVVCPTSPELQAGEATINLLFPQQG